MSDLCNCKWDSVTPGPNHEPTCPAYRAELLSKETVAYQPRYLAYCAAHGCSPDDMLVRDDETWPGGVMCGFILWLDERWHAWRTQKGYKPGAILSEADHAEFDTWLVASVAQREAA